MTARADAQALRLSVAYALLDGFPVIRLPHLRAALAVVEYARASVEWLYGTKTGDPDVGRRRTEWVPLRKSVAYLFRYRDVSLQSNARYLTRWPRSRIRRLGYAASMPSPPGSA